MTMVCYKGHHGTSSENAKKIKKENFFCRPGWFGTGAYFFEDDSEMARNWAKSKIEYRGKRIEVIERKIEVSEKCLLDLTNPKSNNNKQFHVFRDEILSRASRLVKNNETKESLDCKVIDYLVKKDNLDVVRNASYTYTEIDRKNNKIGCNIPNGYEICVANLNCIK